MTKTEIFDKLSRILELDFKLDLTNEERKELQNIEDEFEALGWCDGVEIFLPIEFLDLQQWFEKEYDRRSN